MTALAQVSSGKVLVIYLFTWLQSWDLRCHLLVQEDPFYFYNKAGNTFQILPFSDLRMAKTVPNPNPSAQHALGQVSPNFFAREPHKL